jgi:hypothetical protein
MGRHASNDRRTPPRQGSLLGWGLFVAAVVGASGPALGFRPVAAVAVAATCAVAFGLLWYLSGTDRFGA